MYFKNPDREDTEVKTLFLEARTVTVKRTLVPSVESLEFGEIPVAFKKVRPYTFLKFLCRLKKFS